MNKLRLVSCVFLSLLAFGGIASATYSNNPVRITYMEEDANADGDLGNQTDAPYVFVRFSGKPSGMPACATNANNELMLDPNMSATQSKTMTALLTAAYLAGKPVRVNTNSVCVTLGAPGNEGIIESVILVDGT